MPDAKLIFQELLYVAFNRFHGGQVRLDDNNVCLQGSAVLVDFPDVNMVNATNATDLSH